MYIFIDFLILFLRSYFKWIIYNVFIDFVEKKFCSVLIKRGREREEIERKKKEGRESYNV